MIYWFYSLFLLFTCFQSSIAMTCSTLLYHAGNAGWLFHIKCLIKFLLDSVGLPLAAVYPNHANLWVIIIAVLNCSFGVSHKQRLQSHRIKSPLWWPNRIGGSRLLPTEPIITIWIIVAFWCNFFLKHLTCRSQKIRLLFMSPISSELHLRLPIFFFARPWITALHFGC